MDDSPIAIHKPIPLRAPDGKSAGWALRGFTNFVPLVRGLCLADSPHGEPVMIQVEGFLNVEYRDFIRRKYHWPALLEVSAEAWQKKASSLSRQRARKRQREKRPELGEHVSITKAAMFIPGNRDAVKARIKEAVPLRPSAGKRIKHLVLWDDVLAAFPEMKQS